MKHCCTNCAYLSKEKLFNGQQTWLICDRDVNGEASLENIRKAILTHDVNQEIDCFAWEDKNAAEEDIWNSVLNML